MTYSIYCTDGDCSEAQYRAAKPMLSPRIYQELDDALGWALRLRRIGGVSWEIEGSEGSHLSRAEIDAILRRRGLELMQAGRPRVH
jgi:hypothetical protein